MRVYRQVSLLLLFLMLLLCSDVAKAVDIVRYTISNEFVDPKQQYYIDLLRLALTKSVPEYGRYRLVETSIENTPQARTLDLLAKADLIDVHWSMTSIQREQMLGTVYVPLLKGMMGARVFIIHKDLQANFKQHKYPSDIFRYRIGSGNDWPDSKIYALNSLKVETAGDQSLLKMLSQKRFDLFPRALHEPWSEVKGYPDLQVESKFGLCYPSAMYFFVKKSNNRLRQRITQGLQNAIDDGSFNQLFDHHPITKEALEKGRFDQRNVLKLRNPNMSIRTRNTLSSARYIWQPLVSCVQPSM